MVATRDRQPRSEMSAYEGRSLARIPGWPGPSAERTVAGDCGMACRRIAEIHAGRIPTSPFCRHGAWFTERAVQYKVGMRLLAARRRAPRLRPANGLRLRRTCWPAIGSASLMTPSYDVVVRRRSVLRCRPSSWEDKFLKAVQSTSLTLRSWGESSDQHRPARSRDRINRGVRNRRIVSR